MPQQTLPYTNATAIVGTVASTPLLREVGDGEQVLQSRMRVCIPGEPAVTVPCTTRSPALIRKVEKCDVGAALSLRGSVVSRFWVSAGATGSRVEVVVTAAERCRLES